MKTYKHFIFDFDGTLADSRKNISNSFRYAAQQLSLPEVEATDIYPLIGKKNLEDTFLHFYPELSDEQVYKLVEIFRSYQREHVGTELELFDTVRTTLEQLQKRGNTLHILTTKEIGQITFVLNAVGIADHFSIVYGNGLPYGKKPEKGCVEYIVQTANLNPEETVMVGDSSVDVETAKNGGIDVIGVSYGTDGKEALAALGVETVIDTFDDLLKHSYNHTS